jgi:hypothetical protein
MIGTWKSISVIFSHDSRLHAPSILSLCLHAETNREAESHRPISAEFWPGKRPLWQKQGLRPALLAINLRGSPVQPGVCLCLPLLEMGWKQLESPTNTLLCLSRRFRRPTYLMLCTVKRHVT